MRQTGVGCPGILVVRDTTNKKRNNNIKFSIISFGYSHQSLRKLSMIPNT